MFFHSADSDIQNETAYFSKVTYDYT